MGNALSSCAIGDLLGPRNALTTLTLRYVRMERYTLAVPKAGRNPIPTPPIPSPLCSVAGPSFPPPPTAATVLVPTDPKVGDLQRFSCPTRIRLHRHLGSPKDSGSDSSEQLSLPCLYPLAWELSWDKGTYLPSTLTTAATASGSPAAQVV